MIKWETPGVYGDDRLFGDGKTLGFCIMPADFGSYIAYVINAGAMYMIDKDLKIVDKSGWPLEKTVCSTLQEAKDICKRYEKCLCML